MAGSTELKKKPGVDETECITLITNTRIIPLEDEEIDKFLVDDYATDFL